MTNPSLACVLCGDPVPVDAVIWATGADRDHPTHETCAAEWQRDNLAEKAGVDLVTGKP